MAKRRTWNATSADADEVTLTIEDIEDLNRFVIATPTGSVRVLGSLDGSTFPQQLVLSHEPLIAADAVTEPEGTFVAVTTPGRFAYLFGEYRALQFVQVGATDVTLKVLGTEI